MLAWIRITSLSIGKEGNVLDSSKRSIAKALSYRFFGSIITAGIALIWIGRWEVAAGIGILDAIAKMAAYFVHERLWARIRWGMPKRPDYEI